MKQIRELINSTKHFELAIFCIFILFFQNIYTSFFNKIDRNIEYYLSLFSICFMKNGISLRLTIV